MKMTGCLFSVGFFSSRLKFNLPSDKNSLTNLILELKTVKINNFNNSKTPRISLVWEFKKALQNQSVRYKIKQPILARKTDK